MKKIELKSRIWPLPFQGAYLGSSTRLNVTIRDENDNLIDPDEPPYVIFGPPQDKPLYIIFGENQGIKGKGIREDIGKWYYDLDVPAEIEPRIWSYTWTMTIDGKLYNKSSMISIREPPTCLQIELFYQSTGYPFRAASLGTPINLYACFRDEKNEIVDPDIPPTVTVKDPTGKTIVSNAQGKKWKIINTLAGISRIQPGNLEKIWGYNLVIPEMAATGKMTDTWTATINGKKFEGSQDIEVKPAAFASTARYNVLKRF